VKFEGEITVNVETSEDVEVKEVKVTILEVVEEEVDLTLNIFKLEHKIKCH
jgi:hypothetical protein